MSTTQHGWILRDDGSGLEPLLIEDGKSVEVHVAAEPEPTAAAGGLLEDDVVQALRGRGEVITSESYRAEANRQAAEQHDADAVEEIVYRGDPGGEAVHAIALQKLAARGKHEGDYSRGEYLDAVDEAQREIEFTYTMKGAK